MFTLPWPIPQPTTMTQRPIQPPEKSRLFYQLLARQPHQAWLSFRPLLKANLTSFRLTQLYQDPSRGFIIVSQPDSTLYSRSVSDPQILEIERYLTHPSRASLKTQILLAITYSVSPLLPYLRPPGEFGPWNPWLQPFQKLIHQKDIRHEHLLQQADLIFQTSHSPQLSDALTQAPLHPGTTWDWWLAAISGHLENSLPVKFPPTIQTKAQRHTFLLALLLTAPQERDRLLHQDWSCLTPHAQELLLDILTDRLPDPPATTAVLASLMRERYWHFCYQSSLADLDSR